jgi:hypothetical protein
MAVLIVGFIVRGRALLAPKHFRDQVYLVLLARQLGNRDR